MFLYAALYISASIQRAGSHDVWHDLGEGGDILRVGSRQELSPGERRVWAGGADYPTSGHRGGRPSGEWGTLLYDVLLIFVFNISMYVLLYIQLCLTYVCIYVCIILY